MERSFRLEGPQGLGARPRPELIAPLLGGLEASLLDAVRMGFLHSSRAPGRVPSVLKAAAQTRLRGVEGRGDDVTVLHFELPSLGQAAPEMFVQPSLWDEGPNPEETAFELFGAAVRDVADRRGGSSAFDGGLLRRIGSYQRVLRGGVVSIDMPDTMAPRRGRIDAAVIQAAADLASTTPRPRRVRIVGRLDVMAVSQAVLKLDVAPHGAATVLWHGQEPVHAFRHLLNRDVVVEGLGVFRPAGTLLRLEADVLDEATERQEFFRQIPTAPIPQDYQKLARLRPGEKSAYAQLLGILPAEESDEEFEAALAQLR